MLDTDYFDHYSTCACQVATDMKNVAEFACKSFYAHLITLQQLVQEAEGQSHEPYVKEFTHVMAQSTAQVYLDLTRITNQQLLAQLKAHPPDLSNNQQEGTIAIEQEAPHEHTG
jgi:hypothetical protein